MVKDTGAIKYDGEKARYDLIPAGPLQKLAEVYTFGARKYADRNWEKGFKWSRIFGAAMRHLWAFWRGEDRDPESGLPHPVHAAWCCFALLEFMETRREMDDRPKAPPFGWVAPEWVGAANKAYQEQTVNWKPAEVIPGQVFVPESERPQQLLQSSHSEGQTPQQ